MPLKNYSVLKGAAIDRRLGTGQTPHYQIRVVDDTQDYRIAVNVMSALEPSTLEFLVDTDFRHPITQDLAALPKGLRRVESKPGGLALDFIRGNLLDPRDMRLLPNEVPGPDNDLNEQIDHFVQRAMAAEEAFVYAFGETWGPEDTKDKYFGFKPGQGIHDIHMNQGNVGPVHRRTTACGRTAGCSSISPCRTSGPRSSSSSSRRPGTPTTARGTRSPRSPAVRRPTGDRSPDPVPTSCPPPNSLTGWSGSWPRSSTPRPRPRRRR